MAMGTVKEEDYICKWRWSQNLLFYAFILDVFHYFIYAARKNNYCFI